MRPIGPADVVQEALQADITQENLLEGAQTLLGFADAYPGRTRIIGSGGHNGGFSYGSACET